jgi:tetrahydromethanopterin S-methyltransferase subunit F
VTVETFISITKTMISSVACCVDAQTRLICRDQRFEIGSEFRSTPLTGVVVNFTFATVYYSEGSDRPPLRFYA